MPDEEKTETDTVDKEPSAISTTETEVEEKTTQPEPTYTREALAASKKYREYCDVIMIALEAEKQYTISEAEAKIKAFHTKPLKEEINGKGDK